MKIGMIIVFDSQDDEILKKRKEINFCLVNNNCKNPVSEALTDISDECENVTVIQIRKNKSSSIAVRAGARYINNHFNLKFLGYITDLRGEELVEVIELFFSNYEEIRTLEKQSQSNKLMKQSFFQNIFSISNYYQRVNSKLGIK
jgi:hypothetical protein